MATGIDSSKVVVYEMLGASPNPSSDTLIDVDYSVETGVYSLGSKVFPVGSHNIYAIAYDAAGNESSYSIVTPFYTTSSPLRVSDYYYWTVGLLSNLFIGACGA